MISDEVDYAEIFEALQRAEQSLGRRIDPTVLQRAEWRRKRSGRDSFAKRVAEQPKLFVLGNDDDLA